MEINFAQSDDDDESIKLDQLWCGSNEAPEWLGLMIGRARRAALACSAQVGEVILSAGEKQML